MSDLYTKQEISQLLHVSYKTLRGYEDKGLISPRHINAVNGYKYYDGNQIYTIDMIRYCNQDLGISLKEIKDIMGDDNQKDKLISLLLKKKTEAESMVKKYQKIIENINHSLAFNNLTIEKYKPYTSHEKQIFYYLDIHHMSVYRDGRSLAQQIYDLLEDNYLNFVFKKNSIDYENISKLGIVSEKENPIAERKMQKEDFTGDFLCIQYNNYIENSSLALDILLKYAAEHNLQLDTSFYYIAFQSMDISVAKVEDSLVILKVKIKK